MEKVQDVQKNTLVKLFMLTTKLIMVFHHSETNAILDDLFANCFSNEE